MFKYHINGKDIYIKPKKFEGSQNIEFYENQIYKTLNKIGIDKNHILILTNDTLAQVNWKINGKEFSFTCSTQENKTKNLGSISQAIQDDVRQITRGIKTIDLIMKQYELETYTDDDKKKQKKNNLLDFESKKEEEFNPQDLKLDKEINEELNIKYNYLLKETNEKLDIIYLKFKEECRRANTPEHPLLKALKIIRQRRGLKL